MQIKLTATPASLCSGCDTSPSSAAAATRPICTSASSTSALHADGPPPGVGVLAAAASLAASAPRFRSEARQALTNLACGLSQG